jgi:hypothetical protein
LRYLGLALIAEGPSDRRFLPPVLYRLTEELCLAHARSTIEVGAVVSLDPSSMEGANFTKKVVAAAGEASGTYHVLFLHTDGGGDYATALRARFEPWKAGLAGLRHADEREVAVVPVREMEAWTLADGDALRGAFGTSLGDSALGLPSRPADVERIPDPRAVLRRAYERVFNPRRPRSSVGGTLEAIAERVRLDRLRQVPAFARLEADLRTVLGELHYLA